MCNASEPCGNTTVGAIAAFRRIKQEIDCIPLREGGLFFCAEVRSGALSRYIDDLKTRQCFIKSTIDSSRDERLRLI
ncbi:hypothetical protein BSK51_26455 [Paenibacillus odorifer]|uniref:Uncharacterized protein n=1 Tax=Paenibacillus odorifer TaxID=189426 RepID=A0ABX3HBY9_9BACL|nr:hypothetical protein BSK51_26455 [Paenibacillus odorifer]